MQIGDRTGVERTVNIWFMVVTLEVSKASGWLNANADCRESKRRACGAGRGCGPADGGDSVRRAVEARLQIGGRTGVERTWNMRVMSVTPEVSQLEMSALKSFKL